jgi:hypothetical protein
VFKKKEGSTVRLVRKKLSECGRQGRGNQMAVSHAV